MNNLFLSFLRDLIALSFYTDLKNNSNFIRECFSVAIESCYFLLYLPPPPARPTALPILKPVELGSNVCKFLRNSKFSPKIGTVARRLVRDTSLVKL